MIRSPARVAAAGRLTMIGLSALTFLALFSGSAGSQKKDAPPVPRDGTPVEWEGWTFNWSLRRIEGLVLTDIRYRGRQVLKYAGIAEICTSYDQGAPFPVDLDQNGLGESKVAIVPGIDCSSGEWCKVFDAQGKAVGKGAAPRVMLHEERTGPNYLGQFGRAPGKTLVIWAPGFFRGTVDGYTFVMRWKFRDDGTFIPEIGASGTPQHLKTGDSSPTGAFIGMNEKKQKVFAPSHAHFILYRLDCAIDGEENTVEEFNWEPKQKGWQADCSWTPLRKETGRPCNPGTFRSWRVVNPQSKNAQGHPRSYQLLPSGQGLPPGVGKSPLDADLWVTQARASEFPRSANDARRALDALPKYADGEPVENKSVVLWYWVCFHHFPRSEDWLHQPMIWRSFEFMPRDFLDGSPLKPVK